MIHINKRFLSLALAMMLTALPATTAFAGSAAKERRITGTIVGFDRSARTVKLRERGSDKVIDVSVPSGRRVQVLTGWERKSEFELLMRGMVITFTAS